MFTFTKAFLNNLNYKQYINNFKDVEYKQILPENNQKNLVEISEKDLNELDRLTNEIRFNNLYVFISNFKHLKFKNFFIITLPALISAVTIGSFIAPGRYDRKQEVDVYNKETIHIDSLFGEVSENEKIYYDSISNMMDHKATDSNIKLVSEVSDKMKARFSDGVNSLYSKFDILSDGNLNNTSVSTGSYIDVSNYDPSDYKDIEFKYALLFDNIINNLNSSKYLSTEEAEILKKITESEKCQIIIDIVKYSDIGSEEISINVSRWPLRIFLAVVCIMYGLVLFFYIDDKGINNCVDMQSVDGRLICTRHREKNLYGATKYKAKFVEAEHERIKRIYELARKNFENPEIILTNYEKKLLKEKGDL